MTGTQLALRRPGTCRWPMTHLGPEQLAHHRGLDFVVQHPDLAHVEQAERSEEREHVARSLVGNDADGQAEQTPFQMLS